jgi:hypothetical protein
MESRTSNHYGACNANTTRNCFVTRRLLIEKLSPPQLSIYLSLAVQPLVDLGCSFSSLIYTQSVRLLGRGISPFHGRYLHTEQHKHTITAPRHPFLEWDSTPRSQCWSWRRPFLLYVATVIGNCPYTIYICAVSKHKFRSEVLAAVTMI